MNRRQFIKASIPVVALPVAAVTCKCLECGEKEKEETAWDYRVYCYERQQGEWTFSKNIRGSFAYQREYMTLEEDLDSSYCGWMDGGKLHFASFDDATDFVDCHVRAKDDTNLIDSIYDVYFVNREGTEIKVAHYWFNGDTGRTIMWEQNGFNRKTGEGLTNWSAVEHA